MIRKWEESSPQCLLRSASTMKIMFSLVSTALLTPQCRTDPAFAAALCRGKAHPCLHKPLWAVHPSSLHWGWWPSFLPFFIVYFVDMGVPQEVVLRNTLTPLISVTVSWPLMWALRRFNIIMLFNANMRCKYKQEHTRDSHRFRQCYLLIIASLPSWCYFHSCMHFYSGSVSAEIDLFKFGSWRAKFADIGGTQEDDSGWNCCCIGSVLPSHCIPHPAAKRAPSLHPRQDYCLLVGNIILFGM